MKYFKVYKSGGGYVETVCASSITKAAKEFIGRLPKSAKFELISRECGRITYTDNYTVMSDYVISFPA